MISGDPIDRLANDDVTSEGDRHKRLALPLKVSTSALGAGATILLGWQNLTQSLAEWVDAKQSKP